MTQFTMLHNPRCSKSRQTLDLLQENNINPNIIEYLKDTPSTDALRVVAKKLGVAPKDMLRTKEEIFKELDLDTSDDEAVLAAMVAHPQLIERPIVIAGDRAAIGRPPENVKALFS